VKPVKHPGITMESIISVPLQQNSTYRIESTVFHGFHLFLLPIRNEWHAFWNPWNRKDAIRVSI